MRRNNESIPINVVILKQMRESLHLSVDFVAKKMNKTPDIIIEWESGISSPTYIQLEALAQKIYKRPLAIFFMKTIPYDISPKADFRAMPEEFNSNLPSDLVLLYRKAKAYQLNLHELLEESNLFRVHYSSLSPTNLVEVAKAIRQILGISITEQKSFSSDVVALKNWRNAIENSGIFVFKDAFRNNAYSGFCLYDKQFPIIYINNSMPKTRQIFTLFHELAHLILKLGGVDIREKEINERSLNQYDEIEVFCNKFASEVLLPDEVFLQEHEDFSVQGVQYLANHFSVSREVILRKYLKFSLIDKQIYDKYSNEWINQLKHDKSSRGNYYNNQKVYFSEKYLLTVFQKLYQGAIPQEKAAGYLNAKIENLNAIEQTILSGISA